MSLRERIVDAARARVGTAHQHQGRLRGVALDCIGLPIDIGWELGFVPRSFDIRGYGRAPNGTLLARCDEYFGSRVALSDIQAGDLIVVRYEGDPQHFGVLVPYRHGGLAIVHSDVRRGVIEHRLLFSDQPRGMKFVAAYAPPEVAP